MIATMDGRPSATQSAYTSAARSTAIRIPITSSPLSRRFDGTPILPTATTNQSDLSIAVAAAQAAAQAAIEARNAPLRARAKSRRGRPGHRRRRRRPSTRPSTSSAPPPRRRDRRRGGHRPTPAPAPAAGTSTASTARSASPTGIARRRGAARSRSTDAHGAQTAAVHARRTSSTPPSAARARRCNGEPIAPGRQPARRRARRRSSCARTASSTPASARLAHAAARPRRPLRHAGPGSLELAWIAAGRLDAWIQPDTDPWDWLPGALLVTEAGGRPRVRNRAAGTSPDRQASLTRWSAYLT